MPLLLLLFHRKDVVVVVVEGFLLVVLALAIGASAAGVKCGVILFIVAFSLEEVNRPPAKRDMQDGIMVMIVC